MKLKKLNLLLVTSILFFFTGFSQNISSYVPANGLVGWWPFNGNANNAGGNAKNGNIQNSTLTNDRNGNSNNAYLFNGTNSMIDLGIDTAINNILNDFSISYWFNKQDTFDQIIISSYSSSNGSNWRFLSRVSRFNKTLEFSFLSGTTWQEISQNNIELNKWINVTYTRNGSTAKLYIDGLLVQTATVTSNPLNNPTDPGATTRFGALATESGGEYFNGKIDDIGIWRRALSATEVRQLFEGCKDTILIQPNSTSAFKGESKVLNVSMAGNNVSYQWQSNAVGLGWQNIPELNQYSGTQSSNLTISNLTHSNHNQLLRVIATKAGCADTSTSARILINNIPTDSLSIIYLQSDTTLKGARIRQLETDLADKHDTLYVGSSITSDTLKISIRTGLSLISQSVNILKVYPNPAATLLNIELQKPGSYVARLTGVAGETIITQTTGSIDISGLSDGVYNLSIYDKSNKLISTNKVLIIK